ncbi:two-component regulator propeller domain-containing protein [Hymenobacter sp. GOD-10R]|uniref:two-component regulator propeller domain-containing protein n=1 Tax=Hymenobacter sp. GOD-10R TaxID=3093922 RepID=UPI002D78CE37|nr:two-component regulator propeller domain-containing protein [Hymenobacter sp. GOD-10R]WRQ28018.1 two-component regulator propeller domain-containing protein [Hymenobacter sp. GOD-10R]
MMPSPPTLLFHTFTTANGLSQNSVAAMLQDRRGFLWLGTQDGLNRFDGAAFHVFRNDPQRPGSLSSNYVLSLAQDRQGKIWIGTGGGGLCQYNPITGRMRIFQSKSYAPGSITDNFVRVVFCDQEGRIWVGTEDGLHQVRNDGRPVQRFQHAPNEEAGVRHNSIRAIAQTADGALWVGTGEGKVSRLDPRTNQLVPHPRWQANSAITALFPDGQGGLWAGTEIDGVVYLGAHGEPPQIIRANNQPGGLPSNNVRALLLTKQGTLWVGTAMGLARYRTQEKKFDTFLHVQHDPHSLSGNVVQSLFEDRTGLLWVGTEAGLSSFSGQPVPFTSYPISRRGGGPLWAVYEDGAGRAWIGTESEGLVCYNPKTGERREFRHNPQDAGSLSEDHVRALWLDRQGRLWVGTQSQGLDCLEPGSNQFRHYRHDPEGRYTISDNFIRAIYEDKQGRLWIGTENGLNKYDPISGKFTTFQHNPKDPASLSNNFVRAVCQDHDGQLWIGTGGGGLCQFDPQTEKFRAYRVKSKGGRSLSSNFVRTILEDRAGVLWIGTEGGGFCRLDDKQKGYFTAFREPQGLPNDMVYGILEDDQGSLWLSTNKGIACFMPRTRQFHNFDTRDGLVQDEYNAGAYYRGRSGRFYFGGVSGLVVFRPDEVRINHVPPTLVLTDFRKFNEPVELDTSITERRVIHLSPRDYFFSLEFAALNFRRPDKNRYAYRLENFDPGWVMTGNRHEATYTNLGPGTYTFWVRAANNDGVWSKAKPGLTIIVEPPWYQTWWFRVLGSWGVFGVLFFAYRVRVRQLLAMERVRHGIARDLHDDMGSTLSSISILSQLARNHQQHQRPDQVERLLEQIGESSRRMLDAMDDIVWAINPAHDSLDDVTARMRRFASEVLESRGIDFSFRVAPSVQGLRLDMQARREFFLLFKEAVNNLAKYAQAKEAAINLLYERNRLILKVEDDGVGFDPQAPARGGGNGMVNMRARAAVLKGTLTIQTAPGQGTKIELSIPLDS